MTLAQIVPAHPFSAFIAAVTNMFERAAERRQTHAVYTKTLNELSAMSSRELADIGVHRSEIPNIAAAAAGME
ncbi:DUF1127 domain-containing protein [Tateyamaria armeniaca]|uniref:DUF1127 domain-containing protein n=1 Tax=Tateyamaria armeniaca TaxID=2518930 RepID=A0ABW8UZM2_9RHOB